LANIKYFGKTHNGQTVFLGKHMRDLLQGLFRISPSQVTKRIGRLEEKGFLTWVRLSSEDKEMLFGKRDGKKFALVLREDGSQEIENFNNEMNSLFAAATAVLTGHSSSPFSSRLKSMTEDLVSHLGSRYAAPRFLGEPQEITEQNSSRGTSTSYETLTLFRLRGN
jgi:DNA-binding MarR family transcriptional regulator